MEKFELFKEEVEIDICLLLSLYPGLTYLNLNIYMYNTSILIVRNSENFLYDFNTWERATS